jgi:hypothetical protein
MQIKPINVFVSYRRDDIGGYAGRIYDRLEQHFEVFFDTNSIEPGRPLSDTIKKSIKSTDFLLVVLGDKSCEEFQKKLATLDYVAEEIREAYAKNKMIIPILVNHATMVSVECLPKDILFFPELAAARITHDNFNSDMQKLIHTIRVMYFYPHAKDTKPSQSKVTIFEKLESNLKSQDFISANNETLKIMLKIADRQNDGWLRTKDFDKITCDVLLEIDRLWVKYTGGFFGFSKQLEIIESHQISLDEPHGFIEFADTVHWRKNDIWSFVQTLEIAGHLPALFTESEFQENSKKFQSLLKKFKHCKEELRKYE